MASVINASSSGAGGLVSSGDSSGVLQLQNNGSTSVTLDTSGNVGIGTSSPATKFQVSGTSGSLNARINAGNTGLDVTNNDATGVVNLATSPLSVGSKVMSFTTYNGSSSAEAMRIDSSGNVGIGTSSPSAKLTIASNAGGYALQTAGTVNDYFGMGVYNSNAGSSARSYLQLGNDASQYATFISLNSSTNTAIGGANSLNIYQGLTAPLTFSTAGTERMRIDSSGNLLVGTTSTFDNVSFLKVQSLGGVSTKIAGTSLTSQMSFFNDNGRVGYIGTSGSTTSYNTSSDYRLKENIAPMTGALAKVVALKPVTYTWKANGSDGQGFIAHELQAVVPDCVTGEKDAVDADGNPIYQGVDTSFLVATLTAALQELKAELDEVKAKVGA